MKQFTKMITIALAVAISLSYVANAQVGINKDGSNPGNNSILHIKGDTVSKNIILEHGVDGGVGIGTSSPEGEFHVNKPAEWAGITFNGTGLNDLNVNYVGYNGAGETNYMAEVTNTGPNPNIIKWSNDNGTNWTEDVQMTLSGIDVGNGVFIGFDALNGHTYGDQWSWTVSESFMNGFIVKNGKVGIGTINPQGEFQVNDPDNWQGVTFIGTGLDDIFVDYGSFLGNNERNYIVEVTVTSENPNFYKWSDNNGASWEEDEVGMSTDEYRLGYDGVEISFGAEDGHTVGDQWLWTISEGSVSNVFIVKDGKVGIGTDNPTTELDVNGQIKITDGNQGVDKVLISDENGVASWAAQTETIDAGNYGTIVNPVTGKTWLDRNLGASQVAIAFDDPLAYGDLYQWGRAQEGHEDRSSPNYGGGAVNSWIADEGSNNWDTKFITSNIWLSPPQDDLWTGTAAENNPCPSGFRIPTNAEWNQERRTWATQDRAGAFASPLKLSVGGRRSSLDGSIDLSIVGNYGYYWSSTVNSTGVQLLGISSNSAYMAISNRGIGISVRCIKN